MNANLKLRRERFDDADVAGSKLEQPQELRNRKMQPELELELRRSHMVKLQVH